RPHCLNHSRQRSSCVFGFGKGKNSTPLDTLLWYLFMERILFSMMTSSPCCVFFIINSTILFLLRSKPVFSQCPRYVLLFNLVLADTVLIAQGQALYLLAMFDVWISYPLCGCFAMVSQLTNQISPYVLIFMSLERCVAVCFPFRHCTLVTLRNTFIIVFLIWTVASFNVLTQLPDLQMRVFCSTFSMHLGPKSYEYDTIYTYVLFTLSALVISCSFVGVMVVACLASGDRAQAEKTRYTLLLHLFQLGLNLLSMMQVHFFVAVAQCCRSKRLLDVVYVCVYVCVVLMPRCLSALTYGLRDPTLRPALGTHLCCRLPKYRHYSVCV
uniref:G-protein coupled receptors family 1 profile domain-containing protein n=1 Tax=Neogobius melanostomus TaxID=47308 RepID=A0A8C6SNH7_9GOBI